MGDLLDHLFSHRCRLGWGSGGLWPPRSAGVWIAWPTLPCCSPSRKGIQQPRHAPGAPLHTASLLCCAAAKGERTTRGWESRSHAATLGEETESRWLVEHEAQNTRCRVLCAVRRLGPAGVQPPSGGRRRTPPLSPATAGLQLTLGCGCNRSGALGSGVPAPQCPAVGASCPGGHSRMVVPPAIVTINADAAGSTISRRLLQAL